MKPQCLPLISQIYADKTPKQQNHIKLTTNPICLSLRNNAACCIPLCVICAICGRIHARVLKLFPQMKPQSLPQISQIYADKTQTSLNLKQSVFLCVIMQLAAFLCVICAICGRITRKSIQSILHKWNFSILPLILLINAAIIVKYQYLY
jgi:hypothetical protein